MNKQRAIIQKVLDSYRNTQAIYLYGSYGTKDEWPHSDVDIALLLPPQEAKYADYWALSELRVALEELLSKDVDLINLRQMSTVFQKEIIKADRRIFCQDIYAAEEFEMLVLSLYQKLNEERRELLELFEQTGRAYNI